MCSGRDVAAQLPGVGSRDANLAHATNGSTSGPVSAGLATEGGGSSTSLDLDTLFDGSKDLHDGPARYRLEMGCGLGEWLEAQVAASAANVRWLGVELMARRAHATAARLSLAGRSNAAVLAGDAAVALERWIPEGALEAVYVNHPEPPQQSGNDSGANHCDVEPKCKVLFDSHGENTAGSSQEVGDLANRRAVDVGSEGSHMLAPRVLNAIYRALAPSGTLTIITDNQWYGELLLAGIASHGGFGPVDGASRPVGSRQVSVRVVDVKSQPSVGGKDGPPSHWNSRVTEDHRSVAVELVAAAPGAWCAHANNNASSYFDRLWQTGISVHSSKHERFVIYVQAIHKVVGGSSATRRVGATPASDRNECDCAGSHELHSFGSSDVRCTKDKPKPGLKRRQQVPKHRARDEKLCSRAMN